MAEIVYRSVKGTDLTPAEVDNNFHNVDDRATQLRTDVDLKAAAALLAQPDGIATLNNLSKVIQTALNSDKLDNKTFAQIAALFIAAVAKGAADGVAELDGSSKLKASQIPDSLTTGLTYKGGWDAGSNTPAIPGAAGGNKGWFYVVTTAGATSIDGINVWAIGDWIISNGSAWEKIPATQLVLSVAGHTGDVTLAISDIVLLQDALDAKKDINAESVDSAESDFHNLTTPGDFYLNEIGAMSNRPGGEAGAALITVKKYAANITQLLTVVASGNVYSNSSNGAWTGWKQLN